MNDDGWTHRRLRGKSSQTLMSLGGHSRPAQATTISVGVTARGQFAQVALQEGCSRGTRGTRGLLRQLVTEPTVECER